MGIMDKIGKKIGIDSDKQDNILDDDLIDDDIPDIDDDDESIPQRRTLGNEKVVDFATSASLKGRAVQQQESDEEVAQNPMEVIVIEPQSFDDSQQVSKCLMEKRPVIINFENTDTDTAHRIVDFISGTIYALDGDIRKISRNVFLCAPSNVTLTNSDALSGLGDTEWMN